MFMKQEIVVETIDPDHAEKQKLIIEIGRYLTLDDMKRLAKGVKNESDRVMFLTMLKFRYPTP